MEYRHLIKTNGNREDAERTLTEIARLMDADLTIGDMLDVRTSDPELNIVIEKMFKYHHIESLYPKAAEEVEKPEPVVIDGHPVAEHLDKQPVEKKARKPREPKAVPQRIADDLPLCEICGKRPVKSSRSKICDSDACEKKRNVEYAHKSQKKLAAERGNGQHPFVKAGEKAPAEISEPWPEDGSTWRVVTGTLKGKSYATWELTEALENNELTLGTILEKRAQGMHQVTGQPGKFKLQKIRSQLVSGVMAVSPAEDAPLAPGQAG